MTGLVQVAPDSSGKSLGNEVVTYPPGTILTDQNGVQTVTSAPIYLFREHIINADPTNPAGTARVTDASGPSPLDFGLAVRLPPGQADLQSIVQFLQSIDTNIQALTFALNVPPQAKYAIPLVGGLQPAAFTPTTPRPVVSDAFGRQVVLPHTIRDLCTPVSLTLTASTTETTLIAAGDSLTFNDLVAIIVTNTSATVTEVDIRDAIAGTIVMAFEVPATETRGLSLGGVIIPQSKTGQNWTAQCGTSVTSVKIWALYIKNRSQ